MSSSSSLKVIWAAMLGNTLVALTKFVAAAITGSSAMISEGIHSLVDTGNQILLLHGIRRSKRPADQRHPFGYGKEVYFWSFVVAILIFAVGSGVSLYEGVIHLQRPIPMVNPTLNYVVLVLAMLFEGAAWLFALREFSRTKGEKGYFQAVHGSKDPTGFMVLFEDSAAMTGLAAAFLGIWLSQATGDPRWDGAASIVIGLILAATATWLAYETKGLLIGERADPVVVEKIRRLASEIPEIEQVNEVLTMHMGPNFILVNLSVDFVDETMAGQVEQAICWLDAAIRKSFPRVKRVFIEAESHLSGPDNHSSC